MKSNELFLEIKTKILNKNIKKPRPHDIELAFYNYTNYQEILNKEVEDIEIKEINNNEISDLKEKLDYYFKEYPTYDDEFDEFIKYICLYLHFISKKPFHPAKAINNSYYCNLKEKYEYDKNSLCVDCIAKKTNTMNHFNYFIKNHNE